MLKSDSLSGISFDSLKMAFGTLITGLVLAVGLAWWLTSRHAPKRLQRIGALTQELKNNEGFVGVDMEPAALVGMKGYALTDLRPAGKVRINGDTYDASSTGEFIPSHSEVIVVRYEAAQIYVEKL